ncbi:MAG TPA: hypothetical protein VN226_01180 [Anaerolineales bacterium]|nr:hypothetical protein [Anaerolineales bacterium]
MTNTIFISADHGMAVIYFLQSDVINILLSTGQRVVVLTDDQIVERVAERFQKPGLVVEGLRLKQAEAYAKTFKPRSQWLLAFLRRVGASWRINLEAQDSHIWEVWKENSFKFRLGVLLPAMAAILLLRSSSFARKKLVELQSKFDPNLYADLFEKYQPGLVIASTPGWRIDRYLLREAVRRGVETMTVIVGWDNPSSYAIRGARVNWATCWSMEQKRELVDGSDWDPERVGIGGIPSYDGYLRGQWLIEKDEYFKAHGLDPAKKLISYACSFVHFAPNYPNIAALVELISEGSLPEPSQLLIRLHPSHFQDKPLIFAEEREQIFALEKEFSFVHVVRPVALGGSLGYYGGEDMDEKATMMARSDVLVTVYSTMVVETAVHDTPIIAAVIDTPGGWNVPGKFSLALKDIGNWPTHQRFWQAKAGKVCASKAEIKEALSQYLTNPNLDQAERRRFVEQEITFTDGSAGERTAGFILKTLKSLSTRN